MIEPTTQQRPISDVSSSRAENFERVKIVRSAAARPWTFGDAAGLLVIVLAAIAGAWHFGMQGVEQWDMSIFADGAYRIYDGQMPYRDFHLPLGPVTFYVVAALCRLLGAFTWSNLILANALLGAAATIITFLSLRLFLTTAPSLLFAAVFATTFAMPLSFPWHDVVAMFWATAAFACYLLALRAARGRQAMQIALAGGLTALSILTKQNIGSALFLAFAALLFCVPFEGKEGVGARLRRVLVFGASCFLIASGIALFFEIHGSFLSDVTVANNQFSRLAKLWNGYLLLDDLRFWWEPWRLEIKLLALLASGGAVLSFLRPIRLRRVQFIALAAAVLAVTYFMRKTGVGAYEMYVIIVPFALGLLFAASAPSDRPLRVASWKLLTLWYPGIFVLAGIVAVAWSRKRAADAGEFLLAGRYSLSWSIIMAVAAAAIAALVFSLPSLRRTREINIDTATINRSLAAARIALFVLAVGIGIKSLHVSATRATWDPNYLTDLTPFEKVPMLAGARAIPAVVGPVEDLVSWFQPRLQANPELRGGTQLFVFPSYQLLYSALDVQSFKGVALWYDWRLSYSQEDVDTDAITAAQPRFIIAHEIEPTAYSKPQREMLANSPRLLRHVAENYREAFRNDVFTVFEKRAPDESGSTAETAEL